MSDRTPEDLEHFENFEKLKRKVIDTLNDLFAGTEYAPTEGGVITEAVVCLVWMEPNGMPGGSTFSATNHIWSTEGILGHAYRNHAIVNVHDCGHHQDWQD